VLIFLCTVGLTLPVNTKGVVFVVIGNDLNTVVLRDTAVFFAQAGDAFEYFCNVFDRALFAQAGIELVERRFQTNVEAVANGLFF